MGRAWRGGSRRGCRRADRRGGEVLTDIVMPDLTTAETESSMEINFLIGKLKHTVRRTGKADGR